MALPRADVRKGHATIRCVAESNLRRPANRPLMRPELRITEPMMVKRAGILASALAGALLLAAPLKAQQPPAPQDALPEAEKNSLLARAFANQKKNELALDFFERFERVEIRASSADPQPAQIKTFRAIPAGTGVDRIPVGPDGKPTDPAAFRKELQNLAKFLAWAAADGKGQREAYAKVARKHQERFALIEAAATGFLFTLAARELRDGRLVAKFRFDPNPAFKPTSRATAFFPKVSGWLWIDEACAQITRLEASLVVDLPIGLFFAKIYKGSRFVQERVEAEPGAWLPSVTEYDYTGRKFFSSISVHERTIATRYRRIGPPAKALPLILAELGSSAAASSPAATR